MDNKRLFNALLVSLAIVMAWIGLNLLVQRWYPPPPPVAGGPETQPTTLPAATQVATTQAAPAPPAPAPVAATGPAVQVRPIGQPAGSELGYSQFDPKGEHAYPIGVKLNPLGASVESVTLNRFRQDVNKDVPYVFQRPYDVGAPALQRSLAARSIVVNGTEVDLAGVAWGRSGVSEAAATYSVGVYLPGQDKPLVVSKTYELRPAKHASQGYELLLSYRLENQTGGGVQARLVYNGPNVPHIENSRDIPEVVAGHNDEGLVNFAHEPGTSYTLEKGATSLLDSKKGPMLWAGTSSAYFDGIVLLPIKDGKPVDVADVKAQSLVAPDALHQAVAFTFQTTDLSLAPGQSYAMPLEVFLGPKMRAVLKSDYYEQFPRAYDNTLVMTSGICAFCTFTWLINVLVAMLQGFHWVFGGFAGHGDWGLAIIALVVVVRLLLHPITKRSQIAMSRMSRMGPEIERLKQKYGDNKEELNRAMWEIYKEQGSTPIYGCLPMFLQMPIWIALWSALQSTFELRHAPFLWGFTWISDLSQPDHLIYFPNWGFAGIPLIFITIDAINLLPILMAVVFWLQVKMQPKAPATTPEQEQQQKMMQWMTLLFPLFLYSGPAGLNLYILTSTALGIWESKRVRDHLKEQEEREKAGKVIVDARPTRASRRLARGEQEQAPPSGCMGGWMANLQKKARQIQDETERRYGKGK